MKKKIVIILSILILFLLLLVGFTKLGTSPVSKNNKNEVIVKIEDGSSRIDIINLLKEKGLVKNKISGYILINLKRGYNLQAGTYSFNKSMSLDDMLKKLDKGEIVDLRKTINVTFVEGKRLTEYAKQIADITGLSYDEVMETINDKEYVNELINKYWFLTDEVLDSEIYYPLEGYLNPNTYQIYTTSTVKEIIERMLDGTNNVLTAFKDSITNSGYSVHQILSAAGIIEKEANSDSDRKMVSQVIYKRLGINMSLGMDVTAYYAAKADLKDPYMKAWNNLPSKYNTRNVNNIGLPIGPICNPSKSSIDAALNPSKTDYLYFYADMSNGKVYFAEDYQGFVDIQEKLGV